VSPRQKRRRDATVEEAVALVRRYGVVHINPLRYRRERYKNACFEAAARGLIKKTRINCGMYEFTPLKKEEPS